MYKRGFDSLNQDTSESYVSACPETWVCKDSVLSFDFFFAVPQKSVVQRHAYNLLPAL